MFVPFFPIAIQLTPSFFFQYASPPQVGVSLSDSITGLKWSYASLKPQCHLKWTDSNLLGANLLTTEFISTRRTSFKSLAACCSGFSLRFGYLSRNGTALFVNCFDDIAVVIAALVHSGLRCCRFFAPDGHQRAIRGRCDSLLVMCRR